MWWGFSYEYREKVQEVRPAETPFRTMLVTDDLCDVKKMKINDEQTVVFGVVVLPRECRNDGWWMDPLRNGLCRSAPKPKHHSLQAAKWPANDALRIFSPVRHYPFMSPQWDRKFLQSVTGRQLLLVKSLGR